MSVHVGRGKRGKIDALNDFKVELKVGVDVVVAPSLIVATGSGLYLTISISKLIVDLLTGLTGIEGFSKWA